LAGSPRLFYGWIVVLSCFVISATAFGIRYSFGVFFPSLEEEFGWARGTVSGIFSLYMALAPLFAILGGWALDRFGPRALISITGFFTGLSLVLTARTTTLWQLYVTYSLLLSLGTGATYTILWATTSRWFVRRRGLALGIVSSGAGLGTIVMAPLAGYFILGQGWRFAFAFLGLIAWAFIIPFGLLLKREPAEIGALPDGTADPPSRHPADSAGRGFPLRVYTTPAYWALFFIWLAYSFGLHAVMTHVVNFAQDTGVSLASAALILSLLGVASIPGRLLMGALSDRIGKGETAALCAFLQGVSLLGLIGAGEARHFYLFALVYGFAYGGLDPPTAGLVGELFGLEYVGTVMGTLVISWGLGAALGPAFAGYIFDIRGDYSPAFLTAALLMLLAVPVSLFLRRRVRRAA